jgi:autotransporter family porin
MLGWYADVWGIYGWSNNSVQGDTLPEVRYNAKALTLSGETGYAMKLQSDWVVEPQAQLVYVKYSEDDISEPSGTQINGGEGSGWISRLSVRKPRHPIGRLRSFSPVDANDRKLLLRDHFQRFEGVP